MKNRKEKSQVSRILTARAAGMLKGFIGRGGGHAMKDLNVEDGEIEEGLADWLELKKRQKGIEKLGFCAAEAEVMAHESLTAI